MKNLKEKIKKITVISLASSIFIISCNKDTLFIEGKSVSDINKEKQGDVYAVAFAVAVVVGAVVAIWAVTVTHAATTTVAAACWNTSGDTFKPELNGNDYLIKLWKVKNRDISIEDLSDQCIAMWTTEIIRGIEESYPEIFNNIDKKSLNQLLHLNL